MKQFLGFFTAILFTLPLIGQAANPNTQVSIQAQNETVTGSVWAGMDSDGDFYEYHFLPGQALHYKSPTGFWKNGTWKQKGNEVYLETNEQFTERVGIISEGHIEGKGWNIKGQKWTWSADKTQIPPGSDGSSI